MEKVKFILAIIYLLSPIDIIPEALLGPFGIIDDGVALLYIINYLITGKDRKKSERREKISNHNDFNNYE